MPRFPPEIADLIRGLLSDNDGLHNPLIRPVISWGEKTHWGEVPLDSHDSFVYIGVVFWPVTLEKENVLMRASPHLCLIDSINLDANKVPIL